MRAAIDYRPKPLTATMTLMIATERMGNTKYSPDRDWMRACDTIDLHEVPGGHLNMMKQPHVETLAAKLREFLLRWDATHGPKRSKRGAKVQGSHSEKSLAS